MKKFLFISLFFFIELSAQTQTDSLEFIHIHLPLNILSSRFDKQINTFNLNSTLRFNNRFDRTNIYLIEKYNSTFIRSSEKSIRDDQFFSLSSSYNITDNLAAGVLASSSILSDNRQIELNQASASSASFYTQISPYKKLYIAPFLGYSNNRQIGENDYGFVYGAEGALDTLEMNDLILLSLFKYKNEDISPRKNTLRYFRASAENFFNPEVNNSIDVRFSQSRKDFYFEADSVISRQFNLNNNIQSRTETSYLVQDRLGLSNFLSLFSQEILGGVYWRTVERDTRYRLSDAATSSIFDTKINELRFEVESSTYFFSSVFNGSIRLNYSERDEKHVTKRFEGANNIFYEERSRLESSKNNNSSRATVSISGMFKISSTDQLSFSLFQNKLRYDTPSEFNFDDRDELLSIARLRYSKQITPFLEAVINTEATYNHIVYVLSERSSNNNINRVLRFSAGANYRGRNVTSINNFEVSANYTVYDFEDLNPNYRSFSFRQFTAVDSTIIKFSNSFSFAAYSYMKLSEQGDLKWASFSTKPTRFLQEVYSEPKLVFGFNKLILSFGMRIFSLNTYNYKGKEKSIDTRYLSTGPLMEILLALQDSLFIRTYGWYEFISIKDNPGKELININLEMNWRF